MTNVALRMDAYYEQLVLWCAGLGPMGIGIVRKVWMKINSSCEKLRKVEKAYMKIKI